VASTVVVSADRTRFENTLVLPLPSLGPRLGGERPAGVVGFCEARAIADGRSAMSEQPQVVVRGEAVLTVPPEVADVVATVQIRARDRQTALERCRARLDEVAAVVAGAGDAVERSETGSVSVHQQWQKQGASQPVASVETRLVLGRLETAGDLVVALGRLDDVTVSGPFWRLRTDSPVHAEARLAAVQDAVGRARQYAAAFGAELTALVEVADTGLSGGGPRLALAAGAMARFESSDLTLDLTPAQQEVHGSVEVRFAMTQPRPEVFRA
jgi:uncharacterized protein YggE